MSDKTLGQVAYEGWSAALLGPNANVRHYDNSEALAAWQAAAEAVMRHVLEPASNDPDALLDLYLAKNAVIKTAKAWAQPAGDTRHRLADIDLYEAVKALREVEGEDEWRVRVSYFCKEPGLFTDYHVVETEHGHTVTVEKNGGVELTLETSDGEVYAWLTLDELERLARAGRALKEYDEAETRRVEALREASGPLGMSESGFAGTDEGE